MKPPKAVIKEAQSLIDIYGDRLEYLGDVDGQKAWLFAFPDEATVGFPFLYLYADGEAVEVTGPDVFNFMELYGVKDVEVGSIE